MKNTRYSEWTVEAVRDRVIEAAETVQALPPAQRPREYGNAMPDVVRAPTDAYGYNQTRYIHVPTPGAISRMEQVWTWINDLENRSDRQFVYAYGAVKCRKGRTIRGYCKENGLQSRTFERLIRTIFQHLADLLNKKTLFLASLAMQPVSRFGEVEGITTSRSGDYGTSWMAPDAKPLHNRKIKSIRKPKRRGNHENS